MITVTYDIWGNVHLQLGVFVYFYGPKVNLDLIYMSINLAG